ncbi:hypothetical protein ACP70R_000553 [Stipagrostis hirtigluma subsp. patula]
MESASGSNIVMQEHHGHLEHIVSFGKRFEGNFQLALYLPNRLPFSFLRDLPPTIVIKAPSGRLYQINKVYCEGYYVYDYGWSTVVRSERIKESDLGIFTYIGHSCLELKLYDSFMIIKRPVLPTFREPTFAELRQAVKWDDVWHLLGPNTKLTSSLKKRLHLLFCSMPSELSVPLYAVTLVPCQISGKMYFSKELSDYLPNEPRDVILTYSDSNQEWFGRLCKSTRGFSSIGSGWRDFVQCHSLLNNDTYIFAFRKREIECHGWSITVTKVV